MEKIIGFFGLGFGIGALIAYWWLMRDLPSGGYVPLEKGQPVGQSLKAKRKIRPKVNNDEAAFLHEHKDEIF